MPALRTDVRVVNHGSLYVAHVLTADARDWASTHLPDDALRWGRDGIVIEPRFLPAIVEGASADGLQVEG